MFRPVIALVGRTNVGKSTLFNRLTKSRDAIVADYEGVTRDRHYGIAKLGQGTCIVIDTGGFELQKKIATDNMVQVVTHQTYQAITEANIILFLLDARQGLSTQEHDITTYLRKSGKPIVLLLNKSEGLGERTYFSDFYELGLHAEVIPISATHGQGIARLTQHLVELLPSIDNVQDQETTPNEAIRLAVAGRPNVGKSTLINTVIGTKRLVTFDLPGTTRDAIYVPFERDGQKFEWIDTAGLRRKAKVFESVEKFSVIKTLQAIENAHVALLLLDATQEVSDQDAHIAGFILESGRAVVLAVNKWDMVSRYQQENLQRSMATRLPFLKFAPICYISALKGQGMKPLWHAITKAKNAAFYAMSTPKLTRLLHQSVQFQAPKRVGILRPKLRYAHQGGTNPPIVVIHGSGLEHISRAYTRYLEGRFRQAFDLVGTPLRIIFKSAKNPYV
jgi:GTP-binding protein